MVAYDGSEIPNAAVDMAIKTTKPAKGSVTILHIYLDLEERKSDLLMHGVENAEEDAGGLICTNIELKLKKSGVKYELRVEQKRDIPMGILVVTQKESLEAIVIGTSGSDGKPVGPVYPKLKAQSKIPLLTP
jgi:nucleotide-binding universal stress UspA family protein